MTVSNANNNLASLVSSIEQLEAEHNNWKENTIWLKRYVDELKRKFDHIPELSQIQSMQETILQLSAQVAELQECLNQSSVEVGKKVETKSSKVEKIEHNHVEQKQKVVALTDDEFKFERMLLLFNRINQVEEASLGKLISTEEFWQHYENGDRNFTGVNLAGADLSGNPSKLNLSKANLNQAKLSGNWVNHNLSSANLRGADLSKANLSYAKLK